MLLLLTIMKYSKAMKLLWHSIPVDHQSANSERIRLVVAMCLKRSSSVLQNVFTSGRSPVPLITQLTRHLSVLAVVGSLLQGCTPKQKPLPIFGQRELIGTDTVYHTIGNFTFVDQDSATITNETLKDKIYVADFFFTSCRTICPIMKTQMLRVYQATREMPDVVILSHTIDPEFDTVALLRDFAQRLDVESHRWHFLTG